MNRSLFTYSFISAAHFYIQVIMHLPSDISKPNVTGTATIGANLYLVENSKACFAQFMQPHLWLIYILEIVTGIVALLLNGVLTVSTFYATSIPFTIRRSFVIISLNYSFLTAILIAKKCFLIFAVYYPCVTVITTVSCKLQEFPVVFVYFHCGILPLILAGQIIWFRNYSFLVKNKGRRVKRHINPVCDEEIVVNQYDWTRFCSAGESFVLIFCLCLSLIFTAFDSDLESSVIQKCSIVVAIRNRNTTFSLISTLILFHFVGIVLWSILTFRISKQSIKLTNVLKEQHKFKHQQYNVHQFHNATNNKSSSISFSNSKYINDKWTSSMEDSTTSNVPNYSFRTTNRSLHIDKVKYKFNALYHLVLSFRDILMFESVIWLISLFFTGLALVSQFVTRRSCAKCLFFATELSFSFIPLVIALIHPLLSFWLVFPIRRTAIFLFPAFMERALPPIEPETPPIPKKFQNTVQNEFPPEPMIKILITKYDNNSTTTSSSTGSANFEH